MKKKILITIAIIIAPVLVTLFITGLNLLISTDGMAGNTIIEEIYSPDNQFKAVVFERNAGATTGSNTQISILPSNKPLSNSSGNIFIADTNRDQAPAGEWGGPEVKVLWNTSQELEIGYHKNARLFKSKKSKDGIRLFIKRFQ